MPGAIHLLSVSSRGAGRLATGRVPPPGQCLPVGSSGHRRLALLPHTPSHFLQTLCEQNQAVRSCVTSFVGDSQKDRTVVTGWGGGDSQPEAVGGGAPDSSVRGGPTVCDRAAGPSTPRSDTHSKNQPTKSPAAGPLSAQPRLSPSLCASVSSSGRSRQALPMPCPRPAVQAAGRADEALRFGPSQAGRDQSPGAELGGLVAELTCSPSLP